MRFLFYYPTKLKKNIKITPSSEGVVFICKTKRRGLVLGKRAKAYEGIPSEFNDEINHGFGVL